MWLLAFYAVRTINLFPGCRIRMNHYALSPMRGRGHDNFPCVITFIGDRLVNWVGAILFRHLYNWVHVIVHVTIPTGNILPYPVGAVSFVGITYRVKGAFQFPG